MMDVEKLKKIAATRLKRNECEIFFICADGRGDSEDRFGQLGQTSNTGRSWNNFC